MTCENVMTVLRDNKDSLMAVLEAFVYDPLLNWRLMDGKYNVHVTVKNPVFVGNNCLRFLNSYIFMGT